VASVWLVARYPSYSHAHGRTRGPTGCPARALREGSKGDNGRDRSGKGYLVPWPSSQRAAAPSGYGKGSSNSGTNGGK
jgi:hypothetical protein